MIIFLLTMLFLVAATAKETFEKLPNRQVEKVQITAKRQTVATKAQGFGPW